MLVKRYRSTETTPLMPLRSPAHRTPPAIRPPSPGQLDTPLSKTIIGTPYTGPSAAVSPDGNYLAYYSNESGRSEIYVLDLGDGGGRWQISSRGGRYPQWSAAGDELCYSTSNWDFVAAPVTLSPAFSVGRPSRLFNRQLAVDGIGRNRCCVTKDAAGFLILTPLASTGCGEFTVVVNWQKLLEKTGDPDRSQSPGYGAAKQSGR